VKEDPTVPGGRTSIADGFFLTQFQVHMTHLQVNWLNDMARTCHVREGTAQETDLASRGAQADLMIRLSFAWLRPNGRLDSE